MIQAAQPAWNPQVAKLALLIAGVGALVYVVKIGDGLTDEERRNMGKIMVGLPAFVGVLSFACSKGKWGFCEDVPTWPWR